jgi:hypothetical protein
MRSFLERGGGVGLIVGFRGGDEEAQMVVESRGAFGMGCIDCMFNRPLFGND